MAKQRESLKVVEPFVALLKHRGWTVKNFHGNQYQQGVPDAYILHPDYTPRWIEFKVREDWDTVKLTKYQRVTFPLWHSLGVPIYIIAAKDLRYIIAAKDLRGSVNQTLRERLYKKLFEEPNVLFAMSKRTHKLLY